MTPEPSARCRMSCCGMPSALTTLAAEEAVKEILEGIVAACPPPPTLRPVLILILLVLILVLIVRAFAVAAAPVDGGVLERRLGVDVDHRRLDLFRDLRELVRKLFRFGNLQRRGIAARPFFSLPLTVDETTVPIKIPSESVARITRTEAKRFALRRCQEPLASGVIDRPPAISAKWKLYS